MMKKIKYSILFVLATNCLIAQDFHLSQYESAEMYLNPALAGQNMRPDMDFRASTVYRSQWGSMASKSFSTTYLGYDQKFKERWGLGANLINNQAGASTFRTFNFMLAGSYNIINSSDKKHILTTGLQLGLMNKSINDAGLTFDQQYSSATGDFDQSAFSGENFLNTSIYKFDAAWGIFYKFNPTGKTYHPFIGFAFSHISLPSQNFSTDKSVMPMHWKVNIGADWDINEKITINPGILYMYQKGASEIIIKTSCIYKLENKEYDIRANLGYRVNDAAIVGVGMRYKDFIGLMSYDFNTSYLQNYTGGKGGFELTISYQGAFKNIMKVPSII